MKKDYEIKVREEQDPLLKTYCVYIDIEFSQSTYVPCKTVVAMKKSVLDELVKAEMPKIKEFAEMVARRTLPDGCKLEESDSNTIMTYKDVKITITWEKETHDWEDGTSWIYLVYNATVGKNNETLGRAREVVPVTYVPDALELSRFTAQNKLFKTGLTFGGYYDVFGKEWPTIGQTYLSR